MNQQAKKTIEVTFNAHGNKKQIEAAGYWIDKTTFDIVYGGSKGCTVNSTLVKTSSGKKRIDSLRAGEMVLTINESTGRSEYRPILKVKKYGTGATSEYHKMITFVLREGQTISLTCNHEIYIDGCWMPAGELARRIMDQRSGDGWSLRNFQSWESIIPTEVWTEELYYFKALRDKKGVLASVPRSSGLSQADATPQISCYSFSSQSREQSDGESQRFQQGEQSLGKFGMVHRGGEFVSFKGSSTATIREQKRSSKQQYDSNGRASFGDSPKVQEKNCDERNTRSRIWSKPGDDKGHYFAQELDPYLIEEIHFSLQQGFVYDLQVLDNNNYCVSEESIVIHNSGKSFLGCSLILGDALTYPETNYFIARKTLSDLRKYTTATIKEVLKGWGIPESMYSYNGQDNYYKFYNGSYLFFLECKPRPSDPAYTFLGSVQMTRGMIEEAGEIDVEAKQALAVCIGRWKNEKYNLPGKLLMTCNPAKNFLYTDYYKPHKAGTLDFSQKFVQALPSDNKKLDSGYLEILNKQLKENAKKRLLYGHWEYDDDEAALLNYDNITKMFRNKESAQGGERYITVDLARKGGDRIVVILWDGYKGTVKAWSDAKFDFTFNKIEQLRQDWGCTRNNVLIDADGMGHGMPDLTGYTGFRGNFTALPDPQRKRDANGKVIRENFDNLKSQCGYRIADKIMSGVVSLDAPEEFHDLILEELEQLKAKEGFTGDNKKGIVPKDVVRKILQRSPDFMDAILMRSYFDLRSNRMRIRHLTGNEVAPGQYGLRRRHDAENSY